MRVARRYRWQIILKSTTEIQAKILSLKDSIHRNVSLTIDPNPLRIE